MQYVRGTVPAAPATTPDYFLGWTGTCHHCGTVATVGPGASVMRLPVNDADNQPGRVFTQDWLVSTSSAYTPCPACREAGIDLNIVLARPGPPAPTASGRIATLAVVAVVIATLLLLAWMLVG